MSNNVDKLSLIDYEKYRKKQTVEYFNQLWKEVPNSLKFNMDWPYPFQLGGVVLDWSFIDSVQLRSIPPGKIYRTMHKTGERVLILGTRIGPVVVFTAKDNSDVVGVYYYAISSLDNSGFLGSLEPCLNVEGLRHILGNEGITNETYRFLNIGQKIERIYDHFTDPEMFPLYRL